MNIKKKCETIINIPNNLWKKFVTREFRKEIGRPIVPDTVIPNYSL